VTVTIDTLEHRVLPRNQLIKTLLLQEVVGCMLFYDKFVVHIAYQVCVRYCLTSLQEHRYCMASVRNGSAGEENGAILSAQGMQCFFSLLAFCRGFALYLC
jgi:hypothetical protein